VFDLCLLHRWRNHFAICALIVAASVSVEAQAQGIQGPPGENSYCAIFTAGQETECTYPDFASCQAAVSGLGGFCQQNRRLPGHYLPPGPQLFPTDPLGLYRDRSNDLPPVPPPPNE
jgi:hypothetical protein